MRTVGAIGLLILAALLPLRAERHDVRLLDAVKRRDQKAFDALLAGDAG